MIFDSVKPHDGTMKMLKKFVSPSFRVIYILGKLKWVDYQEKILDLCNLSVTAVGVQCLFDVRQYMEARWYLAIWLWHRLAVMYHFVITVIVTEAVCNKLLTALL